MSRRIQVLSVKCSTVPPIGRWVWTVPRESSVVIAARLVGFRVHYIVCPIERVRPAPDVEHKLRGLEHFHYCVGVLGQHSRRFLSAIATVPFWIPLRESRA